MEKLELNLVDTGDILDWGDSENTQEDRISFTKPCFLYISHINMNYDIKPMYYYFVNPEILPSHEKLQKMLLSKTFIETKSSFFQNINYLCLQTFSNINLRTHNSEYLNHKKIDIILEAIKPLAYLRSIVMNFFWESKKTNNFDFPLIRNLEAGLLSKYLLNVTPFLETLSLDFAGCSKLGDEGIKKLSSAFKNFAFTLRTFRINVKSCRVTDDGITSLSHAVKRLNGLKDMTLNFDNTLITEEGLMKLVQRFENIQNLRVLEFAPSNSVDFQVVQRMVNSLSKSSFYITNISLNFDFCRYIGDNTLDCLSSLFDTMPNLSLLHLNFQGCNKITNQGLKRLSGSLKNKSKLTDLNLKFSFCNLIDATGIETLAEAIKTISVKKMTLSFQGIRTLEDQSLIHIGKAINSQVELIELALNFYHAEEVSNRGLIDLAKSLSPLNRLLSVNFNFSYTNVGDEGLKALLIILKKLQVPKKVIDVSICKVSAKGQLVLKEFCN